MTPTACILQMVKDISRNALRVPKGGIGWRACSQVSDILAEQQWIQVQRRVHACRFESGPQDWFLCRVGTYAEVWS
eukprot:1161151-Pelagomonas_calceolata.AAC.7